MKVHSLLLCIFLVFIIRDCSGNATLHADSILGLTEYYVYIPSLGADSLNSYETFATDLQGDFPEGFVIDAVGGIALHTTGDNIVDVPGDISFSAPVGGDITLNGASTGIHSQDDVNIWSANSGIVNIAGDLHLSSDFGDLLITSYLETYINAIDGFQIGSLHREVDIFAHNGVVEYNSDIIVFNVGTIEPEEATNPSASLHSDDVVDIRANRVFKSDSHTFTITSSEESRIQSDVHNIEIEARKAATFNALDNIISKSASDTHIETLLGSITATGNEILSFYGHASFLYAQSIEISAVDEFIVQADGSIKWTDTTGTALTADTISITTIKDLSFQSNEGNLNINAGTFDMSTNTLLVTASHIPGSAIDISTTDDISLLTNGTDIHIDSTYTLFNGNKNTEFIAENDMFFIASLHTAQANLVAPDGYTTFNAHNFFNFTAYDINIRSNGGVIFRDATQIVVNADVDQVVNSYNLYYQAADTISHSAQNTYYSSERDTVFNGENIKFFITGNSTVDASRYGYFTANPDKESEINLSAALFNFYGFYITNEAANTLSYTTSQLLTMNSGLSIDANAANSMSFSGSTVAYSSNDQINLYAPTGDMQFKSNGTLNLQLLNSDDLVFRSVLGDVDIGANAVSVTSQGSINFRGGQAIYWDANDASFQINADNINIQSGSAVGLFSESLSVSGNNTYHYADEAISFFTQDSFSLSADTITVTGGDVIVYPGKLTITSNALSADHPFGVLFSGENTYFSAPSSLIMSAHDNVFLSGGNLDLQGGKFTSKAGNTAFVGNEYLSMFGNSITISTKDHSTITAENFSGFAANYYDTTTGNLAVNAGFADLTGDNIGFSADESLVINGVNFYTNLADFQYDENTYDITGNNTWNTCKGDISLYVGALDYTVSGNLIATQKCGDCVSFADCHTGDFELVSRSNRTQTIRTTYVKYDASTSIDINGGTLYFSAKTEMLLNSTNSVYISSSSYDNYLTDEFADQMNTGDNLNITIEGAAHFLADGFNNNFYYQDYGILMVAEASPANFLKTNTNYTMKVPTGEIIETAARKLRIATLPYWTDLYPIPTLGQNPDLMVAVTRDVLFHGGQGSIDVTAGGLINNPEITDILSSIEFLAVVGNITARAELAQMKFKAKDAWNVTSVADSVNFGSAEDMLMATQRVEGQMFYEANFGKMQFTDLLDTSMIAGSPTDSQSSIYGNAGDEIYITTGQSQVFHSSGAVTRDDGVGIALIGDEASITFTSGDDIEFFSSAHVDISAQTDLLQFNIQENIQFFADGRIDYDSQFTSNFTVTDGNIEFHAFGGGGSVSITSDDGQDITATAGQGVESFAYADTVFYSINGFTATSQTGDISMRNGGVNQDMFFLSQGSVVLQAADTRGIAFYGQSFHADAFQDVLFDCNFFTVDSNSATNTATEPRIMIHGGGDSGVEGVVVNSIGQMSWTTNKASGVTLLGRKIDFEVGVDIKMNTNGPILFENKAIDDDGVFTITSTTGTINIDGEQNAALVGITSARLTTTGGISFEAIGTDVADGVSILSRNDLEINTPTFDVSANTFNAEYNDILVNAGRNISIVNSVGDGGSISFKSDQSLDFLAGNNIDISSSGEMNILSDGEYSEISFESQAGLDVTSGAGIYFESSGFYLQSPNGIVITSPDSIDYTATDDINFVANDTASYFGRNSVDISTTDLDSNFIISASGSTNFTSASDISIDSTTGTLAVHADTGLNIQNRIPTRPRDQGDIRITSYGELDMSSNDYFDIKADRNFAMTMGDITRFHNYGDVTFESTYTGAEIIFSAEKGNVYYEASSDLNLSANDNLVAYAYTMEFGNYIQTFDEGFGGIAMITKNGPLAIDSSDTAIFESEVAIHSKTNGYVQMTSTAFDIASYGSGGDIVFTTPSDIIVNAFATISNDNHDFSDPSRIHIQADGKGDVAAYFHSETSQIVIDSSSSYDSSIHINSLGEIWFATGDIPGDYQAFNSNSFAIISTYLDDSQEWSMYWETDNRIEFAAVDTDPNIIAFSAEHATGYFESSENHSITAGLQITFEAGDDFFIQTGFTPAPLATLDERIAILFSNDAGTGEMLIGSNYDDLIFTSEDVSWSITGTINVRTNSVGGGIYVQTVDNPLSVSSVNDIYYNTGSLLISASFGRFVVDGDLYTYSRDTTTISSQETTVVYSANSVNLESDAGNIVLSTPYGHVDLSEAMLFIPFLQDRANINFERQFSDYGSYVTTLEHTSYDMIDYDAREDDNENQIDGCEERAFGFARFVNALCYCDFNKWRCHQTFRTRVYDTSIGVVSRTFDPNFTGYFSWDYPNMV